MSRMASPSRLVPNTTMLMATPGKMTSHGAVRTYSAADSDSMRPQDGCGSGTPSPRNASADSTRIAEPNCAVQHVLPNTLAPLIVLDGDPRLAHADGARRLHERHLAERQGVGANDTRDVGHQRNGDGDDGIGERGAERGGHDQGHDQQRQRLHDVDQALHEEVDPAAEEAR